MARAANRRPGRADRDLFALTEVDDDRKLQIDDIQHNATAFLHRGMLQGRRPLGRSSSTSCTPR